VHFSNHICYTVVACAEGRATLESDLSAVAGTVWLGRAGVQLALPSCFGAAATLSRKR
jgi:hypothetical protein